MFCVFFVGHKGKGDSSSFCFSDVLAGLSMCSLRNSSTTSCFGFFDVRINGFVLASGVLEGKRAVAFAEKLFRNALWVY